MRHDTTIQRAKSVSRYPVLPVRRVAAMVLVALCLAATAAQAQESDEERAMSEYTKGVFLLESDSPDEAVPHLETAWILSDQAEMIGQRLAVAYFRSGDLLACDQTIDVLLEKYGRSYDPLLLRAKLRYMRGQKEECLKYLDELTTMTDRDFDVARLRAKVLFELGRDEEAIDAYADAIRIDGSYPFLHYKYGLLLKNLNRRAEAEKAFRDAVKLEPRFSEAATELAGMMIEDGRPDDAIEVLRELLRHDEENQEAMMMLANVYLEQGQIESAIELLEAIGDRSALTREGLLLLGRLYYEAKNYDEALTIFEALFERGYETADMARVLAEISLLGEKMDKAEAYYRKAIDISPQDYRNYLSLFFASSPRFSPGGERVIELADEERMRLLDAAAGAVHDDDFEGLYLVGVSYQSVDSYPVARTHLERALELRPGDRQTVLNLASALEKMNEYEEARRHIAALHAVAPDDPTVCNFYGYLLALLGQDLDTAEQLIKTALKHEPDNGYYIDSLGWVYYMQGDYRRAVIELERATNLVGDDPVILEHLGDAYRSQKRFNKALAAYERSRDLQGDNDAILDKIDDARRQLGN